MFCCRARVFCSVGSCCILSFVRFCGALRQQETVVNALWSCLVWFCLRACSPSRPCFEHLSISQAGGVMVDAQRISVPAAVPGINEGETNVGPEAPSCYTGSKLLETVKVKGNTFGSETGSFDLSGIHLLLGKEPCQHEDPRSFLLTSAAPSCYTNSKLSETVNSNVNTSPEKLAASTGREVIWNPSLAREGRSRMSHP